MMAGAMALFQQFTNDCPTLANNSDVKNIIDSMNDLVNSGTTNLYTDSQTINNAFATLATNFNTGTLAVSNTAYKVGVNDIASHMTALLNEAANLTPGNFLASGQEICTQLYGACQALECFPEVQSNSFPNSTQFTKLNQDLFQLIGEEGSIASNLQEFSTDYNAFVNSGAFSGLFPIS